MTAWGIWRAKILDEEIADNYAAAARVAARYLKGGLPWEEAQKRWAFQDRVRASLWRQRMAIT